MPRDPEKARASVARYQATVKGKAARAKYQRSEKYRAKQHRWRLSEKNRQAQKRYRDSAKGQAARDRHLARNNARRLQIGKRYVGLADTPAAAAAINAHIRRRLDAFIKGLPTDQGVETDPPDTVQAPAGIGPHPVGGRRTDP